MLHTVLLPVIILFFKSYWDYTAKLAPIDIPNALYCILYYYVYYPEYRSGFNICFYLYDKK